MLSAVDGELGAREPDLGAGRTAFISLAFSHMECEILDFPSQSVTPLSPGRGGRAGGRRVWGMSVAPESDMPRALLCFRAQNNLGI